jgi:hypothetical protein
MATEAFNQYVCQCCHRPSYEVGFGSLSVENRLSRIEENVDKILEILNQTQPEK